VTATASHLDAAAAGGSLFAAVERCWACGGRDLQRYHQCGLHFPEYRQQDHELDSYTGQHVWLVRCRACGFGQPDRLPTLANYFDRMYDQRWSEDWVTSEFDAEYKDLIFRAILRKLARCCADSRRRLLDVGAHAGRFMHLAQQAGWEVEGIELNARTAACAARRTGAPVHQVNAQTLSCSGRLYSAVTLTDVLEHIPEPVNLLSTVARLLEPGGCVAVKVPCGSSQWRKERVMAALRQSRRISLAENLVHVSHFSPRALRLALERAGFVHVTIRTAAPELRPLHPDFLRPALSNALRLAVYAAGRLPGALHTPLALNLQAYARLPRGGEL
jgi:2-polyprenyl-3-methyl-5-hydroxy-6-metoxy-1,4-benzoquinol methylase